jgi:hypothetical protein
MLNILTSSESPASRIGRSGGAGLTAGATAVATGDDADGVNGADGFAPASGA